MFQNIIFDWSGVVNDNTNAIYKCNMEIFKAFNTPLISCEEFRREFETPYMRFLNRYIPTLKIEDQNEIFKNAIQKYDQNQMFKDADKSIKKFFDCQINMFVVSSDFPETILKQVKLFGLENIFKEIVYDVHDKTESADKLVKNYNLNLDKTIFIGDTNHEIEAGKKVGIKTGAVTWGICLEEKLKSYNPDFMVHNLDELEKIVL